MMQSSIIIINYCCLLLIILLSPNTKIKAEACVCLASAGGRYNLEKSYHSKSVMHVKVMGKTKSGKNRESPSFRHLYVAQVLLDYKGDVSQKQYIVIRSVADEGLCGKNLNRGQWIVSLTPSGDDGTDGDDDNHNGGGGVGVYDIMLCDFHKKYIDVTKEEMEFLNSRMICKSTSTDNGDSDSCVCGDGSQLVQCLVDPCEVSTCKYAGAKCKANYCGGCNAEWTDDMGIFTEC